MKKLEKTTQIIDKCGACPEFLHACPGLTRGDFKKGAHCLSVVEIDIGGKKFAMNVGRCGDLAPIIKDAIKSNTKIKIN